MAGFRVCAPWRGSNGQRWNASAQQAIEREGFGEQVSWEHLNHDGLLALWQRLNR